MKREVIKRPAYIDKAMRFAVVNSKKVTKRARIEITVHTGLKNCLT